MSLPTYGTEHPVTGADAAFHQACLLPAGRRAADDPLMALDFVSGTATNGGKEIFLRT